MDYLIFGEQEETFDKEVKKLGSRVYTYPALSGRQMRQTKKYFEQFFSEHHSEYDIVHLHAPYIAFLCLPVAAKYGISHRIVHSHATVYAESKGKAVRNRMLWSISQKYITDRIGCSQAAGAFLFGKKDYTVLKNAICCDEYAYNETARNEIRTQYQAKDKLVIGKYEYDGSTFLLLGADSHVKYLNLTTTDGNRANLDKGYYISNVMAYSYGIKAGDDFTFVNPTTMEEKTVKIEGIISNNTQKLLISNMDDARELLGWQKDTYNGLLSDRALQLGDEISKTVTSDDIKEQMNTVLDEMGAIIYSLAVIGAIICIAALYVSVNMLVSENRHTISMLKVLGLKDREINRMVLDVNHMIIPIGIVTGIGAGYGIMDVVFKVYSGMEGVMYVTIKSIVLTVVIVVLCYVVSLLMVRRKADRVDMVESLKDNRE